MLTTEEKRIIDIIEKSPKDTPHSWTINTLKVLIKSEVEKFVISKCASELTEGEMLVVNVEVGDMPHEGIFNYLTNIKKQFEEAGINKIILVATRHGEKAITLEKIKEEALDKSKK